MMPSWSATESSPICPDSENVTANRFPLFERPWQTLRAARSRVPKPRGDQSRLRFPGSPLRLSLKIFSLKLNRPPDMPVPNRAAPWWHLTPRSTTRCSGRGWPGRSLEPCRMAENRRVLRFLIAYGYTSVETKPFKK